MAHPRRALVPVIAAVGGAVVPAAIFLAITWGTDAVSGWGVPMATDPAFAVGILALVAPRAPAGLRAMLLAIATVDDVLAVLVIAFGYARGLTWGWLAAAAAAAVRCPPRSARHMCSDWAAWPGSASPSPCS
ncbi:Na+/H+ antiporter NhaA [Mycolicibacter sinensis]